MSTPITSGARASMASAGVVQGTTPECGRGALDGAAPLASGCGSRRQVEDGRRRIRPDPLAGAPQVGVQLIRTPLAPDDASQAGQSAPEPTSKDGKDAFHRVPFILGEVRDAVERVLTRFRGARCVKRSGDSLSVCRAGQCVQGQQAKTATLLPLDPSTFTEHRWQAQWIWGHKLPMSIQGSSGANLLCRRGLSARGPR